MSESGKLGYVIFLGSTAALGGLLFGFDIAIITGAGPYLAKEFALERPGIGLGVQFPVVWLRAGMHCRGETVRPAGAQEAAAADRVAICRNVDCDCFISEFYSPGDIPVSRRARGGWGFAAIAYVCGRGFSACNARASWRRCTRRQLSSGF